MINKNIQVGFFKLLQYVTITNIHNCQVPQKYSNHVVVYHMSNEAISSAEILTSYGVKLGMLSTGLVVIFSTIV